jgi:predicted peroxiredoxin
MILSDFVANGGRVWACGACTGPRGITSDDLVDGVTIVTAANLAEALADGARSVAF